MEDAASENPARLDEMSSDHLLPVVYDELRRLAAARLLGGSAGMTLQPTALVHEAWIRLGGRQNRHWESRDHFFNAAALTMRRILMDRIRQKASLKRTGPASEELALSPDASAPDADARLMLIDECLQRLEQENPEDARIVLLKFYAGLTNQEIAESLGVNVRTVERKWAVSKIRLFQMVREIERDQEAGRP